MRSVGKWVREPGGDNTAARARFVKELTKSNRKDDRYCPVCGRKNFGCATLEMATGGSVWCGGLENSIEQRTQSIAPLLEQLGELVAREPWRLEAAPTVVSCKLHQKGFW
jgi:hypothetical protein